MVGFSIGRRTLLSSVAAAAAVSAFPTGVDASETAAQTDPNTRATFTAIVDAVVPETPDVADELGDEHGPGGLEVGLDAYLITYVNTLFSGGHPVLGDLGDLRLAEVVAKTCDAAAVELLARGENTAQPDPARFEGGGPFAALARDDRLRALALLDEKEVDTAALPGPVIEGTAGLIPQLVVAFTQVIYYSEFEGYDDVTAAPSDREFADDGLQSWAQTDFPGVIDGAAALRGYWGRPDSSLGAGRPWKTFESDGRGPGPRIYRHPGSFEENEYDTGDYEEPYDTSEKPADSVNGPAIERPERAVDSAREVLDDDLLERAWKRLFGGTTGGGARG